MYLVSARPSSRLTQRQLRFRLMSTQSAIPRGIAMPVTATASAELVAAESSNRFPLPDLQHAEEDVRTEPSTTNLGVTATFVPGAGVTVGNHSSPVPQIPHDVHPEPSTRHGLATSIELETAPPPDRQDAAQDDLSKQKYYDPEWVKTGAPDTKFYKDYPPDIWGQEAAPNARVWKIYRDEMTSSDADTLKSWNDTVDVLLIFAGLFSAVSTAFVIESYKTLQPDYSQYIANVVYMTAASNRSLGGMLNFPAIGSMGPPDSYVHPSSMQRWTNGLWFMSLVLSLTVALLCILIKQWLDQYWTRTKRSAPSLHSWARRHQIYYRGLSSWGVPTLISLLPLLLHVSLFLFFAGLVLFLQPLDGAIFVTLLAILVLTVLFYVLALVVPAFCIDCPSYTPLLAQARSLITFGVRRMVYLSSLVSDSASQDAKETSTIEAQKCILDGRALNALLVSTNDPDVIDAGVEAIGAVSAKATLEIVRREGPLDLIHERAFRDLLATGDTPSVFAVLTNARRLRTVCTLAATLSWTLPSPPITQFCHSAAYLPLSLGLEGFMLESMINLLAFRHFPWQLYDELCIHFTHSKEAQADDPRSPELSSALNHTTCQLFLRIMCRYRQDLKGDFISCVLLAFCAGDFAKAEPHDRAAAIQNMLALLECSACPEAPPGHAQAVNEDDAARDALGRLFDIFATHQELLAEDPVARSVIHQLGLLSLSLYQSFSPDDVPWKLSGLAAFAQSPIFAKNVTHKGLQSYIDVLERIPTPSDEDDEERLPRYWTCVAILLKLERDFEGRGGILCVRIERFLAHPRRVITAFGCASDNVLLNFVRAATAFNPRDESTAKALSCLLCYRLRTQSLADEVVQTLFTGTFLTDQFRDQMSSYRWKVDPEDARRWTMTFAKHCARISNPNNHRLSTASTSATDTNSPRQQDAMLRICDHLENFRYELPPAMQDNFVAFMVELRSGLEPGGQLRAECDPSCDCWPQPEPQPPAEPTNRTKWRGNHILGRIRGSPVSVV